MADVESSSAFAQSFTFRYDIAVHVDKILLLIRPKLICDLLMNSSHCKSSNVLLRTYLDSNEL